MAQRFGGKYSPGGTRPDQPRPDQARPDQARPDQNGRNGIAWGRATDMPRLADAPRQRAGFGSWLLFVTPFLFLIPAFFSTADNLFVGLAAGVVLLLSAWLTRDGILAHAAWTARRVARRPAFPRKIAGALLNGAGLGIAASMWAPGLTYPILFGVVGAALHLGSFGPDPLTDKGMEGVDQFQTDRVARAVDEAEKHVKAMKDAILRTGDRQLDARVERFAATARALFRTVEADPRDLTGARKYLSVYLMGARDATVKFADFYAQTRAPQARADYEALLSDLETNFASRTQTLLTDNHADLDVEIAVLRDRLKLEG